MKMVKIRLIEMCSYTFCEEYHEDCEYNFLLYHGSGGAVIGDGTIDEMIVYKPFDYHPNKLISFLLFAESLIHESWHIINKDLDLLWCHRRCNGTSLIH